jgi:Domain of unknown function (DUF4258)
MAEVVPLDLTEAAALRMLKELAAESRRIVILGHCQKRMVRRHVSRRQVELCLQKGTITEGPLMNTHGNWQVNVFRHAAGEELTCTVAIEWAARLLVVTVF